MQLILIILLLFFPTISHADVKTGLVGWWKLDEGTGTTTADSSVSGKNGTLSGGTTWVSQGRLKSALTLDGTNGLVTVADAGNIYAFANTTFTVTYWFKTLPAGSGGQVISKGGGSSGGGGWTFGAGTTLSALTKNNAGGNSAIRNSSTGTLNDGQWHLGVAVCTTDTAVAGSNNLVLYVDGALNQGALTTTNAYSAPSVSVTIGSRTNPSTPWFAGSVDDIRIYSRALSASDVLELYNQGIYGNVIN